MQYTFRRHARDFFVIITEYTQLLSILYVSVSEWNFSVLFQMSILLSNCKLTHNISQAWRKGEMFIFSLSCLNYSYHFYH